MNILIIGLGSVGKKHKTSIINRYPKSKIFALRSNKNSIHEEGVENVYNISDIIVKINFIIISNPTYLHEETIIKCSYLECPLFIEKPVLSSLENAIKLSILINDLKIKTYVACNMRFHPSLIFLKNNIEEIKPKINEVNVYFGSNLQNWRSGVDYRKIYSSNKDLGGGVHLDLIHEIDYCVWLFGKPLKINSTKRKVSNLQIDSFDFASYTLSYNGFTVNIILNYYRVNPKRVIEIVCETDIYITDLIENYVYSVNEMKNLYHDNFDILKTYDDQLVYFVNSLNNDTTIMNNFDEGLEVLKIALYE